MANPNDIAFDAMNNATATKADNLMASKKKVGKYDLDRHGQEKYGFGSTRSKSVDQYRHDLKMQKKHLGGLERVIDKPGAKGFFQKVLPGGATGKQLNPAWLESESEVRRLDWIVKDRSDPKRREKADWEADPEFMTKERWGKSTGITDVNPKEHWTAREDEKYKYERLTDKDYTPPKSRSERRLKKDAQFVKRYEEGIKETIGTRFENVE